MRVAPALLPAIAVYAVYGLIIFGFWALSDVRYTDLVGADVIFKSVLLPLGVGALFVVAAVSWLGWWRPVLREASKGAPRWAMWLVLAAMLAFGTDMLLGTNWPSVTPLHLTLLILAGLLVGFNEEAINRGVLITGFRGARFREVWVALGSAILFGAMHVPNALFGMPLASGIIQGVFAFFMGCGFYVLRRVSGSLLPAMLLHGLWDFSAFLNHASGAGMGSTFAVDDKAFLVTFLLITFLFPIATYLAAIVGLVAVLRRERGNRIAP